MILVHKEIFAKVMFEENKVSVLAVENPKLFAKLVIDFYNQTNGGEGGFLLSTDDYEILNINKKIEFIPQPAIININDKRLINKLYSSLKEISTNEENYHNTTNLFSAVTQYIQNLCNLADFDIDLDNEFDINSLFKSVGLKFYDKDLKFAEKLLDYILTVRDLLKINIFVVVNLKAYLNVEDIKLFEKSILDHKVSLLLLESNYKEKTEYEKTLIIDNDLCEI